MSKTVVKETQGVTWKGDTLGYAQVSTADQDAADQQDRLIKAGASRVFTDVISRHRFEPPGLAELVNHARPGDRLCVTRLNRLSRSLKELLETVEDIKKHDLHLVSLEERIDTASVAGEHVFHLFSALTEFERNLNQERTQVGFQIGGLRQAKVLCEMSFEKRLEFIAEGLPIILESAHGYWKASCRLKERPREAEVLQVHAAEEAAKILILMDAVRCPRKIISSKIGKIVQWFYDHLTRLIYAEATYLPFSDFYVGIRAVRQADTGQGQAGTAPEAAFQSCPGIQDTVQ